MKTYKVFDIIFDTDGEDVNLPQEIEITVPDTCTCYEEVEEFLSDEISNITGWCHKGFQTSPEIEEPFMDDLGFRIDSDTGERITSGFVFDEGVYYTASEEKALEYAKKHGYKDLQESYDDEFHYWTEWNN